MKAAVDLMWIIPAVIVFMILGGGLIGNIYTKGFGSIASSAYTSSFDAWTGNIMQVCVERTSLSTGLINIPKGAFYAVLIGNGENMQRFNKLCDNRLCFCLLTPSKLGDFGYTQVYDALTLVYTEGTDFVFPNIATLQFKEYSDSNYIDDMKEWTDFFVANAMTPFDMKIWACKAMHSSDLNVGMGCNSCPEYTETGECSTQGNVLFSPIGGKNRYVVLLIGGQTGIYFDNVQISKKKSEGLTDSNTNIGCIDDSECSSRCLGFTKYECANSMCVCKNEDYTKKILFYTILR